MPLRNTSLRNSAHLAFLATMMAAAYSALPLHAQPPQTRPDSGIAVPGGDVERPATNEGRDWPRLRQPNGEPQAGERGMAQEARPEIRIAPGIARPNQNWYLGVYPERAPRGVRLSQIIPGTPAHRFGLEENDYILDIGGYVVGEYQGRFYPLSMAIEFGVGRNGWAELLVWNKRTFAEETLWVQFQRR